jgi:uracil-DNA glycosylase
MLPIKLSNDWHLYLASEFNSNTSKKLITFLNSENKKIIYPDKINYFKALELTPLKKIKVVILGQDPYHGPNQAHGLSFSVPEGIDLPPSLKNIFKELKNDLNIEISETGDLTRWAKQGVLLLNSVLSVEKNKPASHQKQGWEEITDRIISVINENCEHVVFILWGAYAQKKAGFVNTKKHLILQSVHPSPLSSYRGFFGSKPFSKTNAWLKSKGITEIKW